MTFPSRLIAVLGTPLALLSIALASPSLAAEGTSPGRMPPLEVKDLNG